MPELPEVETTRRGVEPHCLAREIVGVDLHETRMRWPVPVDLANYLVGHVVRSTARRGKYILLEVGAGNLLIHLGMSGSLRVVPIGTERKKHDHIDILLEGGMALRYHDPRRFGCVLWVDGDPQQHPLLAELGPEPLTEAFDSEYLHQRSRGRQVPIKTFIMDSKVVVGVGNIYANEALFAAGINPNRKAAAVSKASYQRLVDEIKQVLDRAINVGGTTLRDFVNSDGQPGYFKQSLAVYGRGGQPCVTCFQPLKEMRLGQRSTVYCTHCQR